MTTRSLDRKLGVWVRAAGGLLALALALGGYRPSAQAAPTATDIMARLRLTIECPMPHRKNAPDCKQFAATLEAEKKAQAAAQAAAMAQLQASMAAVKATADRLVREKAAAQAAMIAKTKADMAAAHAQIERMAKEQAARAAAVVAKAQADAAALQAQIEKAARDNSAKQAAAVAKAKADMAAAQAVALAVAKKHDEEVAKAQAAIAAQRAQIDAAAKAAKEQAADPGKAIMAMVQSAVAVGKEAEARAARCAVPAAQNTAECKTLRAETEMKAAQATILCQGLLPLYIAFFQERVPWGETEKAGINTDKAKVAEIVWGRVLKDKRSELDYRGVTAGSVAERCLKEKVIVGADRRLQEHVDYWTKNPGGIGGQIVSWTKDFVCTVSGPFCIIFNVVQGAVGFIGKLVHYKMNLGEVMMSYLTEFRTFINDEINFAKTEITALFGGFKTVIKGGSVSAFIEKTTLTVQKIVARFSKDVQVPTLIAEGLSWVVAPLVTAAVTPAVLPLIAVYQGVQALMNWAIPELFLGVGTPFDKRGHDGAPEGFLGWFLEQIRGIAGIGKGGIIRDVFERDPSIGEKVKNVVLMKADVTRKVQAALELGLKVANAARAGTLDGLEKVVVATQALPIELSATDVTQMTDGLANLAEEQLWLKAREPLANLLGAALGALDRLLDIPRNALVAAVGTVPFVGGVMAAVLNFGLGIIVQQIKDAIQEMVLGLAKDSVHGVTTELKIPLAAQLAGRASAPAKPAFAGLLRVAAQLGGEARAMLKAAADSARATMKASLGLALEGLLLRGVDHAELRQLVGSALTPVSDLLGQPGVTVASVLARVLAQVAAPVSQLVAKLVPDATLSGIVRGGLQQVLQASGDSATVRTLAQAGSGLTAGLASRFFEESKAKLATFLRAKYAAAPQRATDALAQLKRAIDEQGFGALFSSFTWRAVLGG